MTTCQCGCGKQTNLARQTVLEKGWIKGQPLRFVRQHHKRTVNPDMSRIGTGICACGCEQPTKIATKSDQRNGLLKGHPLRFICGHQKRKPKAFCKHGHEFALVGKDCEGHCKACNKIRARTKYVANLEESRAKSKTKYVTNREKSLARERNAYIANPRKALIKCQIRRARKLSAPVNDLTAKEWDAIKQYYNYRCVYCGKKAKNLTQDHITPLSKGGGHTVTNVVPACRSCNSKKHAGQPLCPIQPLLLVAS